MLLNHKKKVIDLSADYRINSSSVYKQWYKSDHKDKSNLKKSVYGLPELYRENIKEATVIWLEQYFFLLEAFKLNFIQKTLLF